MKRIKNLLRLLKINDLDSFIFSTPENVSYLTQFISRDAYFLVSKKGCFYFTDGRYIEEVKPKLKNIASLVKTNGSLFNNLAKKCNDLELKRVGFEERHLPYAEYKKLKNLLKPKIYFIPCHGILESLRQTKDSEEISKIRQAIKITGLALEYIKDFIRPGMKELEIVAELERFIRYQGASGPSFDIIVASGPNSSLPHHAPTTRRLQNNEPVMIDLGVDYSGYKSDLTRVFFLGKISVLAQEIYKIVLTAQEKAIKKIRAGIEISTIAELSRKYIADKGYAKYFVHNLGHGVGLNIHEDPSVSVNNTDLLRPGMILTIEPAIYLPNRFGIRIEDMILVNEKGCEVLSGSINK